MGLLFLARDGSRQLPLRVAALCHGEPLSPQLNSVSRFKHTFSQELYATKWKANVPESSSRSVPITVKPHFSETGRGMELGTSKLEWFTQAARLRELSKLGTSRGLCRGAFCDKPPSMQGSSRCFGSVKIRQFNGPSSWHSTEKTTGFLPQKILVRYVSNDSIVKKLKLPPVKLPSIKLPSVTLKQPIEELKMTATRYKDVAGIQMEAFWKRNVMILVGAGGILACFLLWQIMYGVANLFVSFSEGMAKFGFLAMAAATVAFSIIAIRARYTINPDKVYRIAMRMLNTSAAALEVLGPPLTGTDLRAYVMSSGGLKLKSLKPRISSRRCFFIFPIQGSEKKGLVSAEVKKKKGKYEFKLLAVDVAIPGTEQRLYLVGDETEYKVGGGLVGQLRDPMLKAMAAQDEFDAQDEKEAEEEARAEEERRIEEAKSEETRRNEEIARLEREYQNK
ncbi:hypothetical protein KP509_05G083600 [Ceratopteris richardii]|uniref:Uncharacterized protein n=1 Tax=Ceratopteris richardii TaxID=49495 RepID=A0A8T2UNG4_CERRI|nr:hypothetical protein KP509_05G083600 [Ceratopteris richardii]